MQLDMSNLDFSFERKNDSGFDRTKNDIEDRYLRQYLSRIRDGEVRLTEILQKDAVFATYDIIDVVIFSDQAHKVPDPEVEGMEYFNPVLENLLENLGYDIFDDAILDNATYSIEPKAFLSFNLADLCAILDSGSVSSVLVYLAEH